MIATTHIDIMNAFKGDGLPFESAEKAKTVLTDAAFPTQKQEAWKYTSLEDVLQRRYLPLPSPYSQNLSLCCIPDSDAHTFVFVNGQFHSACRNTQKDAQIIAKPLTELAEEELPILEKYFGNIIENKSEIFTALNTAFATQGMFIYIPAHYQAEASIHIQHLHDSEVDIAFQHRNVVIVGENAGVKIIETYHGAGKGHTLRNAVSEVFVAKNGNIEYLKFQNEGNQSAHIENLTLTQDDHTQTALFTITTSGELVRNNITAKLVGERSHVTMNGAYLIADNQHVDNYTEVHHKVPHCTSSELYKGLVGGTATAVFSGKIQVYPDAQKTQAYQSSRNILLSDTANIYTKPQLEIYADDVKCSHGATTGQMNEEALFYLQARGIPKQEARKLLMNAFLDEVLEGISLPHIKSYLKTEIHKYL